MAQPIEKYSLDEVKNKFIGEAGTPQRDAYEMELRMDLIGQLIKQARKERNLTQSQLGELIGVQKSQISKIENNAKNISVSTIIRVFEALKAEVKLKIQFMDQEVQLA